MAVKIAKLGSKDMGVFPVVAVVKDISYMWTPEAVN